MDHITLPALRNWQNFYEIVGSSAGALTGLQFVVITLITQTRPPVLCATFALSVRRLSSTSVPRC